MTTQVIMKYHCFYLFVCYYYCPITTHSLAWLLIKKTLDCSYNVIKLYEWTNLLSCWNLAGLECWRAASELFWGISVFTTCSRLYRRSRLGGRICSDAILCKKIHLLWCDSLVFRLAVIVSCPHEPPELFVTSLQSPIIL